MIISLILNRKKSEKYCNNIDYNTYFIKLLNTFFKISLQNVKYLHENILKNTYARILKLNV